MRTVLGILDALGTMPDHPTKAQTTAYIALVLGFVVLVGLAGGSQ